MNKRLLTGIAIGAVAALGLTACATDDGANTSNGNNGANEGDLTSLTIGVFNGWPEGEAASYLWKIILEDKGYDVSLEYADAGPVFAGLSTGDYDVALDGWLPLTHADYVKEYSDVVDLGAWNEDAVLTLAVNEDAPITSIDELAANADAFGNKIIGIEPGAGLTQATQEQVIPTYGLDDMEFITSSTPAMLAELSAAIDADENVVVTLWRPHWAYDEFPIRDLEDPEGTLGDEESIHTMARPGFEDDYPQLTEWLKAFTLDSELLYSLENAMYNVDDVPRDFTDVVTQWMSENQDYVDSLTS
ncbi:MAG TPA: glycine betaine ABC transporter substrate-binding protein [Protaetiibacter sp.]|nr:glycine betaine ABC transporter substrate-binding protein [Protaetiibacter sp.]